jgi:hypothetical protein
MVSSGATMVHAAATSISLDGMMSQFVEDEITISLLLLYSTASAFNAEECSAFAKPHLQTPNASAVISIRYSSQAHILTALALTHEA